MKKVELEKNVFRKKRFTFLTTGVVSIVIVLAIVQLLLSNHLASYGRELSYIEKEKQTLAGENELLSVEIAKASSIATISQKATDLSFAPAVSYLVVGQQEYVALLRTNGF